MNQKRREYSFRDVHTRLYTHLLLAIDSVRIYLNYILFACLLFVVSGAVGYMFPMLFEEEIISLLSELLAQTEGLGPIALTQFIMANNISTAFSGMLSGIFLGIVPLFVVVLNGYVIGFVAVKSVTAVGAFVLWQLVPHGIFEIPAILIGVGFGLMLGVSSLSFLVSFVKHFWARNVWVVASLVFFVLPTIIIALFVDHKTRVLVRPLWESIVDAFRVFVFVIVPLLVIAGIIEGALIALLV